MEDPGGRIVIARPATNPYRPSDVSLSIVMAEGEEVLVDRPEVNTNVVRVAASIVSIRSTSGNVASRSSSQKSRGRTRSRQWTSHAHANGFPIVASIFP